MCDEHPCDSRHMCRLDTKKCVPLRAPQKINNRPAVRVKIEDSYFVGSELAVNHIIGKRFSKVTELPCTIGPDGIETKGEFVSAFGPETIGVIDLETGEVLCELTESVLEALELKTQAPKFLEGKEDYFTRIEVTSFPTWNDKYITYTQAKALASSGKYMVAIAPTQYLVEIDNLYFPLYHAVPVGAYGRDISPLVSVPVEEVQVSIPPKGMMEGGGEEKEEFLTVRRERLPAEIREIVQEFRGTRIWDFSQDQELGPLALAPNSMRLAINYYKNIESDGEDLPTENIEVWNYQTQTQEKTNTRQFIDVNWATVSLYFNPVDDDMLLIVTDGPLFIWQTPSNHLYQIPGVEITTADAVFGATGIIYYSKVDQVFQMREERVRGGPVPQNNILVGYDPISDEKFTIDTGHIINGIATGPNGEVLTWGSDVPVRGQFGRLLNQQQWGDIRIFRSPEEVYHDTIIPVAEVTDANFSPDGQYIVTSGLEANVYDLSTKEVITLPITLPPNAEHPSFYRLSFNAIGDRIIGNVHYQEENREPRRVQYTTKGLIVVWDTESWEVSQMIDTNSIPYPDPNEPYWVFGVNRRAHTIELFEIE